MKVEPSQASCDEFSPGLCRVSLACEIVDQPSKPHVSPAWRRAISLLSALLGEMQSREQLC